jgi:hypothetical protein
VPPEPSRSEELDRDFLGSCPTAIVPYTVVVLDQSCALLDHCHYSPATLAAKIGPPQPVLRSPNESAPRAFDAETKETETSRSSRVGVSTGSAVEETTTL